jgi:membrane fusion protein, heavy metal efflux system
MALAESSLHLMRFGPQIPVLVLIASAALCSGCKPAAKAAAATPPAKVPTVAQEVEVNTVHLAPEAEKRLGIELAAVEMKQVSRVRSYGGEIALPPGASIVISAPVGGRLEPASGGSVPAAGMLVAAKQPILRLTPLLSPERDVLTPAERINMAQAKNMLVTTRIDAAGQLATAKEQVTAAKIALDRAERLFRDAAGTAKAVDDAKAQLNIANAGLQAAEERQRAVDSISLEGSEPGEQTPLVIEAPQAGMLRTQNVAPGEVVAVGAPLFEVMKFDPIWVRVPVYAGETGQLALDQPAEVVPLNSEQQSRGFAAKPISAPPTATALAATVDLYYQLANAEGRLRPGERMTVRVKLQGASEQRVVAWSAVMHDIHGGTWVYENTVPQTYVRRRVQVRYVVNDLAVLESGPAVGAKIVTEGAVELFGTEFGFAK